jgi:hypothetical protein
MPEILMPNMTNVPSIYVPGKVRTRQSPIYDSYVVAAGSNVGGGSGTIVMFTQIENQITSTYPNGVPGYITNMQQANQLQGGVSFVLGALRLVPIGMAEVDLNSFMQNFRVQLQIGAGQFAYSDAPPEYWAGGAGSFTPGTGTSALNGFPDSRAIVPFDVDPILLTDGVNFRVKLIGNPFTASSDFFLRVYLDGQFTEPAQ